MSEKYLLLFSAKSGVLVSQKPSSQYSWPSFFSGDLLWLRTVAVVIGIIVVLVGAADIFLRITPSVPNDAGFLAFAPAIVALDPGVLTSVSPPQGVTPLSPAQLSIPSLGVNARVEEVGVKADGGMANPSGFATVGWYKYGSQPGAAGRAVIAGHVNNALGLSGVFARLSDIAIGEKITVSDKEGRALTYVVREKTQYATKDAPLKDIFTITGPSELVLITCEGDWIPSARSYDKRLVVVAELLD